MAEGAVLAFDFGDRHIGVATGQTITRTATALTTLAATDGRPDWKAVRALVSEWRPVRLVVGLPLNMDDTESEMSARARAFAAQLQKETRVVVEMADERLTSRAVADIEGDQSHAAAAALIAETWLNAQP
ncbi:MAG: Holliday junction resolvase RuvX [Gammaproteobacteria bacterium]|nr:MAG: Holliday junction resolvase RuvX [Gammaproteobacteria bacterium]